MPFPQVEAVQAKGGGFVLRETTSKEVKGRKSLVILTLVIGILCQTALEVRLAFLTTLIFTAELIEDELLSCLGESP